MEERVNMTFGFWKCILENQTVHLCVSAVLLILTCVIYSFIF